MPSLVPSFEYDIFVSYRHNDNLDGWVTEFVQNLEKELKSVVKESLSVYFDKNPHDGILETHDVDDSLQQKLRCLIFIPLVSQTYCDVKCFAWNRELIPFIKSASEDQLGLKIKLRNGNVASRVLPLRIHELDDHDELILENEIGQVRAIDFIFKSDGVNRSLRPNEEHAQDNLNKTYYRDQMNKTANAIKEICSAIVPPSSVKASSTVISQLGDPIFRKEFSIAS